MYAYISINFLRLSSFPFWMPLFQPDGYALPVQSLSALLTSAVRQHIYIWRPFFPRPPNYYHRCGAVAPSPRIFLQSATDSLFCRTVRCTDASRPTGVRSGSGTYAMVAKINLIMHMHYHLQPKTFIQTLVGRKALRSMEVCTRVLLLSWSPRLPFRLPKMDGMRRRSCVLFHQTEHSHCRQICGKNFTNL